MKLTIVIAILLFATQVFAQEAASLRKTSHTYKTVGDLKIQADVYRPADDRKRPVVVWIHGGALILGNRSGVPKNLLDLCQNEGYALVSIDYRLAPEAKLPEIVGDVEDALSWIRGDGAKAAKLDPERMIVGGGSAGGYLTLTAGFRAKPRPTALVAYWGYGDVDGDWYTKPSEFYRKQRPLVSKDDAMKAVGGKVLTGSETDFDAKGRGQYYLYLRQNGLWTNEVTGFDPKKDRDQLTPYCPVRNVTKDYPPTIFVHGTEDTDVPYSLSADMAAELTKHKVTHELVTVKGAGHGLSGGSKKLVDEADAKALAFIRMQMNEKR